MSDIKTLLQQKNKKVKDYKKQYQKNKKVVIKRDAVPDGLYDKCSFCGENMSLKDLYEVLVVCPKCGHHGRIRATERIKMMVDENSFREKGLGYITLNPLEIKGYDEKITALKEDTSLDDAFIYGYATIKGYECVIGVMDSYFLMGSMGSVVGEKVTRSFEFAEMKKLPLIIFTASGGARMQEGIFSLMQMAKTSAQAAKFSKNGNLYVSVLTHPTTGGVTASFAMLGDIILAEPNALIGFAGPRVIEQTIGQKLPDGFQRSEFVQDKGFIDKVVDRRELRDTLATILKMHKKR